MYDCVFPTRTARFGSALVETGSLNLRSKEFANDMNPIDKACSCSTCKLHTRAYLHAINKETVACHLVTVHNIAYQMRLMKSIQQSIMKDTFPSFIQQFMSNMFPSNNYPTWVVEALDSVNVKLL
ncbi:queuine tRNA-ribosyltransferase catalytic subunit 1-like [Anneissia japonica]|uniref:queuine tRNA-ribosyltransferase catalytic subunit 1-like n=1 Tax=Anneissia japonica TaxID=1529436 RepID=UPI0014258C9A|nr:queuine tRNA-ribosyltransferase catalytic subunit 1-like [Anneissia japonica]